jgi:hypothetical protein
VSQFKMPPHGRANRAHHKRVMIYDELGGRQLE